MSDECDVCQREQNIKHLLLECTIYVKPLWKVVEKICAFRITFNNILGIEEGHSQDCILILILFLVHKEWLLFSLVNTKRYNNIIPDVYKNELTLRLIIYGVSSCNDPYETKYINLLIDLLS